MNRWITSSLRAGLLLFLIAGGLAAAYEWVYVMPAKKCESGGDWWDNRDRQCLTPIPIWRITGHLPDKVVKR